MIIQRKLSYWRIHNKLKNSIFQPTETEVTHTRNLAILFNADHLDKQKTVLEFRDALEEKMGYKTSLLGFMNRRLNKTVSFGFKHVSLSDIEQWGSFSGKTWNLFRQKTYFVVISLNLPQDLMLDWMTFNLRATHKIGIHPLYPKIYDIVIDPASPLELSEAIAKSLDIFERINL